MLKRMFMKRTLKKMTRELEPKRLERRMKKVVRLAQSEMSRFTSRIPIKVTIR